VASYYFGIYCRLLREGRVIATNCHCSLYRHNSCPTISVTATGYTRRSAHSRMTANVMIARHFENFSVYVYWTGRRWQRPSTATNMHACRSTVK